MNNIVQPKNDDKNNKMEYISEIRAPRDSDFLFTNNDGSDMGENKNEENIEKNPNKAQRKYKHFSPEEDKLILKYNE